MSYRYIIDIVASCAVLSEGVLSEGVLVAVSPTCLLMSPVAVVHAMLHASSSQDNLQHNEEFSLLIRKHHLLLCSCQTWLVGNKLVC